MDFSAQSTTHDDVDDRDATMMMRDDDDDEEEEEEDDGDADPSNTDNVMEEPQPQPSGQQEQPAPLTLGGSDVIKKPAFCLLDGMQDDDGGSRVTYPIYRLPATMGRTLENNVDKNFVGMGSHKFLSRQHVKIQYLIPTAAGGCGQIQSKVQKPGDKFYFNTEDPVKADDIQIPRRGRDNETKTTALPETGFFAITCLGKNRISVNGQRVEQGQTCLLEPGAAVRLGGFALYFLTPLDDSLKTTMEVRDDVPPTKKRRISLGGGKGGASVSTAIKPVVAGSGAGAGIEEQAQPRQKPKHPQAGSKKGGGQALQTELDALPTKELLKQMNQGIEDNIWDRRHQLIGSTLSYRAVLSATRSSELQSLATEHKGELSRGEIMDWIAESDRYKAWVEHMLSKMEAKSYQASITKALLKAGFERTSSHGRYIKWIVPSDLFSPPAGGTDEGEGEGENDDNEEEEEEEDNDDNDDDDGDSDQSGDDQEDVDDATGEVKSVGSDQSDEEEEEADDDDDNNNNTPDEPDGANHDTAATSAEEVTGVASTDET